MDKQLTNVYYQKAAAYVEALKNNPQKLEEFCCYVAEREMISEINDNNANQAIDNFLSGNVPVFQQTSSHIRVLTTNVDRREVQKKFREFALTYPTKSLTAKHQHNVERVQAQEARVQAAAHELKVKSISFTQRNY